MSLGRNYTEALQKAMRSIDKKGSAFSWTDAPVDGEALEALVAECATPTDDRMHKVLLALRSGATVRQLFEATGIDPWFLDQMVLLNEVAAELAEGDALSLDALRRAKRHGFSDAQIAEIRGMGESAVRELRWALGLHPVYKTVDTCAAAHEAQTPYHYSSYDEETEVAPRERPAVIILGSGPNRIGQGIEFDYSCVHATLALAQEYETVMVNCNPETVSTDYDISDRLYFEPLTLEDVLEVYLAEKAAGPVAGMLVQLGGQTPLSLANDLKAAGVPIIGTSPEAIDAAEDRAHFGTVLADAGLHAPAFGTATSDSQTLEIAESIGYPVLVRPSYVLGGRGMEIVYSREQLLDYLARDEASRTDASRRTAPLLVDRFLDDATEIDVDALYDGHELFLGGIMEHIEECGIHSGDSACVLPPVTLSQKVIEQIREATEAIAKGVDVRGLINIQYGLMNGTLYVIEANPRASRTVPFVSKATGVPLAKAAAWVMTGRTIAELKADGLLPETDATVLDLDSDIAVKEVVLPFKRFQAPDGRVVDTVLGPEMRSTGEVMGFSDTFPKAFAKSQEAAYGGLPNQGTVFVSVADRDKGAVVYPILQMVDLGFSILSTSGTAAVLRRYGVPVEVVRKQSESAEGERTIIDRILNREIDIVVNTPGSQGARKDGYAIRAATNAADVPIITTIEEFGAAVQAVTARRHSEGFDVESLQSHDARREARAS